MSSEKSPDSQLKTKDCNEEYLEYENAEMGLSENRILEPSARIKALADIGNTFEVDFNIPPRRYYRSGLEMVRMADVYYKEGNLENAYILYMKFMTLFLEKIRTHPKFRTVPVVLRAQNDVKLKDVLLKAEQLKVKLTQLYQTEYDIFLRNYKKKNAASNKEGKNSSEENEVSENITKSDEDFCKKPTVDDKTKPALMRPLSQITFDLRDIIVPLKLMSKFLTLALRNTEQNKETCGILAGVLQRDNLFISHLLIPKQVGNADSCSTENEEEIFAFQDEHNLITLGWIHTHPSQTAFLSSVDLHTQCSYQLMMPEALAVVCSPKNQENCFFMLTPEYGLDFIANCRQTGFHTHPTEPPLYKKADHVKFEDLPVEVVDLRRR